VGFAISPGSEPIPGYKLIERLGAGGYGEVWECEAPGGLTKAIKFVYGHMDDERAGREAKSLNRVKAARHPFLLSLERIEVLDGQLVILTELAELSLKERFDECVASGQGPGIERDELLIYIRDTADALDYMSEQHALQHLDVKPENLLLLGGRIKVADFGLVKEVREHTASLMGGLTPLYAPPEVFDGRPTRFSDQYSLAIVYQEMLTGVLPFDGASAAQLASQHLNAKPNTSLLPAEDRPAIEKALSKNPHDRYQSCVEFVDALCRPKNHSGGTSLVSSASKHGGSDPKRSKGLNRAGSEDSSAPAPLQLATQVSDDELPSVQAAPRMAASPMLTRENAPRKMRPTILISLGGVGGNVIRRYRRRIYDQFGDTPLPAIRVLAIDSDQKALAEASRGSAGALTADETIATPLRRPQDYRGDRSHLLNSMSRRWVYNIPRSQQTEGLRPLGRLALLDSGVEIFERIKQVIAEAVSAASVEATSTIAGREFDETAPRVIITASTCGGAGSGMAPEVGYLARKALAELELSGGEVIGMLTYGSGRNPTAKELGMSSALACLSEISHFSKPDETYPGEPAIGLSESKEAPFDISYLVSFGDNLSEDDFGRQEDELASYLYLDTLTPATLFLQHCRLDNAQWPNNFRTLGIAEIGGIPDELMNSLAEELSSRVVRMWRGDALGLEATNATDVRTSCTDLTTIRKTSDGGEGNLFAEIETQSSQKIAGLDIQLESLLNKIRAVLEHQLESDPQKFFTQLSTDLRGAHGEEMFGEQLKETIVQIVGPSRKECPLEDLSKSLLGRAIQNHFQDVARQQGEQLASWVTDLTDQHPQRIAAARHAAGWCLSRVHKIADESREITVRLESELETLEHFFLPPPPVDPRRTEAPIDRDERRLHYFTKRLHAVALQGVRAYVRTVCNQLQEAENSLTELHRQLKSVAENFSENATFARNQAGVLGENQASVLLRMRRRIDDLAIQADRTARDRGIGELSPVLRCERSLNREWIEQLANTARGVVLQALKDVDVLGSLDQADSKATARFGQYLKQATPAMIECGGGKRMLMVLGESVDSKPIAQTLKNEFSESPHVMRFGSDAFVCFECQGLSLPHIAVELVQNRPDLAKLAARLRSRSDIGWNPWTIPTPKEQATPKEPLELKKKAEVKEEAAADQLKS